jgi:oxygen-independent coproporphyrinogen-3 oxidase
VQNASDLAGYSRAVSGGRFATVKGLALSASDRLRGAIIERLMCDLAVDLETFGGREQFTAELARLRPLCDEGLLEIDGGHIAMTERGRPYLRIAASAFDTHLAAANKRHSIAV